MRVVAGSRITFKSLPVQAVFMLMAGLAVVCLAALYGYVAGVQEGFSGGRVITPLYEAMTTHQPDAIAKVIPSVLQAAKNDKEVLLWAVAVTNDPSLSMEHQAAVVAYCQAKGSIFAEISHRIYAVGVPPC